MTHNRLFTAILGLALTCLVSNSGLAQSGFTKNFVDTTDNAFDMSPFLNSVGGFLPVPIIITEPAVGFGGGLTAVVFHRKKKKNNPAPRKGSLPPIMTAAGGAYTSNGTWLAFLGHQGSYKQDRFRYTGAIGGISANLAYYNENLIGDRTGVNYNMKGIMTFHEFLVRPKKEMPLSEKWWSYISLPTRS